MTEQNYINHIALVLDASSSMTPHAKKLIEVADSQVAYLAQRSKELDQETRITAYSFSGRNTPRCLIYDKDVLRVPSIAKLYRTQGMTALIDATILSLDDLKLTPEKYGEHAFLIYVLTDGKENNSIAMSATLKAKIAALPDHWTIAAFVPDQIGIFEAKKFGFPAENIAIWDATTAQGISEAGEKIRQTTDRYMQNRAKGIRGTRSLFRLSAVSVSDITRSLVSLTPGSYALLDVKKDCRIDEFFTSGMKTDYQVGKGYYQLTTTVLVQPKKAVAILANGDIYTGENARSLLGLPDYGVRVKPHDYADYTIFVQSRSLNRKLLAGTRLLVLR